MDAADLAILREMCRDRAFLWAGMDPRISTDAIARRLGVAGSTVRARLRAWRDAGFLQGVAVLPNPSLLGARLARLDLQVQDPRHKRAVLEDLRLVDGVLGALDHVGPTIGLGVAHEDPARFARTLQLLARLPGVDEVGPADVFADVPVSRHPTALDWRLVGALRTCPDESVQDLAAGLGMSVRTFTRHYQALADAKALWAMPLLDFTHHTGGVVGRLLLKAAPDHDRRALVASLRGTFPDMLELFERTSAQDRPGVVDLLLHRPSLGALEDALHAALAMPGVLDGRVAYPRKVHLFPAWFDERIAARAALAARAPAPARLRRTPRAAPPGLVA